MDLVELISKIGIPAAYCVALGLYVKMQTINYRNDVKEMRADYSNELREIRQEHREETRQMTEALNSNTEVMRSVLEKLKEESNDKQRAC